MKSASLDRSVELSRETRETKIDLVLRADGRGDISVSTGLGFLDHMLTCFAFHAGLDLHLNCQGDLEVDDHHTAEDCALLLGRSIRQLAGTGAGLVRFGSAFAPLDEALSRVVVDLSGRPFAHVELGLRRPMLGSLATENLTHFFISLAMAGRFTLHVDVLRGDNDHHRAESAFKSLALALREALSLRGDLRVPSTKGALGEPGP